MSLYNISTGKKIKSMYDIATGKSISKVYSFTPSGKQLVAVTKINNSWKFTADSSILSVAVDTNGNVYAGTGAMSVYKLTISF